MIKARLHKSWNENFSETKVRIVKNVINWSFDYYDLRDKNHTIDFYAVEKLESIITDSTKTVAGRYIPIRKNKSEIHINCNMPLFVIIQTLFHEITHLKHVLKHDICFTPYGKSWRGTKYPDVSNMSYKDYLELPDEKDARKQEINMLIKWSWEQIVNKLTFWRK